jgi:hypothetical protein
MRPSLLPPLPPVQSCLDSVARERWRAPGPGSACTAYPSGLRPEVSPTKSNGTLRRIASLEECRPSWGLGELLAFDPTG